MSGLRGVQGTWVSSVSISAGSTRAQVAWIRKFASAWILILIIIDSLRVELITCRICGCLQIWLCLLLSSPLKHVHGLRVCSWEAWLTSKRGVELGTCRTEAGEVLLLIKVSTVWILTPKIGCRTPSIVLHIILLRGANICGIALVRASLVEVQTLWKTSLKQIYSFLGGRIRMLLWSNRSNVSAEATFNNIILTLKPCH